MIGDPAGERQAQRRQERPVGADAVQDRLRRDRRERHRLSHDDPERLPPAEFDEHRLARLEIAETVRYHVGVCPVPAPASGINRDLDGAAPVDRHRSIRERRVELHGLRHDQGDRE